jgi:hypothetical protein
MKEIKIQFDTYSMPESWEELAKCESPRMATILKLCLIGKDTLDRNGMELLVKTLLDVPSHIWECLVLSLDQWVYLCNEVDWVFKLPLLVPPFNSLKVNGEVFSVPNMEKPTAIEIAMGLVYFTQFGNGDEEAADFLIAVFCRRPSLPYSRDEENRNAPIFKEMDPWQKSALIKFFTDCLADFISQNDDMFGEGGKPIYEDGEGWYFMLGNAVKAGFYTNLADVYTANAAEVWGWMRNETLEAARQAVQNK